MVVEKGERDRNIWGNAHERPTFKNQRPKPTAWKMREPELPEA